jgi:hypothetical protein
VATIISEFDCPADRILIVNQHKGTQPSAVPYPPHMNTGGSPPQRSGSTRYKYLLGQVHKAAQQLNVIPGWS